MQRRTDLPSPFDQLLTSRKRGQRRVHYSSKKNIPTVFNNKFQQVCLSSQGKNNYFLLQSEFTKTVRSSQELDMLSSGLNFDTWKGRVWAGVSSHSLPDWKGSRQGCTSQICTCKLPPGNKSLPTKTGKLPKIDSMEMHQAQIKLLKQYFLEHITKKHLDESLNSKQHRNKLILWKIWTE